MENNRTEKAWQILYNEDPEFEPDPNKPENVAFYNAKKKERRDAIVVLMRGPGKVLFEMWHKKIKTMNIQALDTARNATCNCETVQLLRQMDSMFQLWLEAEMIMNERRDK